MCEDRLPAPQFLEFVNQSSLSWGEMVLALWWKLAGALGAGGQPGRGNVVHLKPSW